MSTELARSLARIFGHNIHMMRGSKDRREGRGPLESGIEPMAEYLGVTPETVSRWETGKVIPRDDRKIEIAEYLEVDARDLFPLERP